MKNSNHIMQGFTRLISVAIALVIVSCTADPIMQPVGSSAAHKMDGISTPGFHSRLATTDSTALIKTELNAVVTDELLFGFPKCVSKDVTVRFWIMDDFAKLEQYAMYYDTFNYRLTNVDQSETSYFVTEHNYLPQGLYSLPLGEIVIPKGSNVISLPVEMKMNIKKVYNFKAQREELHCSHFLIVCAEIVDGQGLEDTKSRAADAEHKVFDFRYDLRFDVLKMMPSLELLPGHGVSPIEQSILWVNPSIEDPRVALDMYMKVQDYNMSTGEMVDANYQAFDQIILDGGALYLDKETQMPRLGFKSDLQHVLNHKEEHVAPLQAATMKVLVDIHGGGVGVGFANFTPEQSKAFARDVAQAVNYYQVDGVNLSDELSGYGLENTPEINPQSYARLLVDLREAMGPDKLLTVTDLDNPATATLYKAVDGVQAAGEVIDFAWCGEPDEDDHYEAGSERGTIYGLPYERYVPHSLRFRDGREGLSFASTVAHSESYLDLSKPKRILQEYYPMTETIEMFTGMTRIVYGISYVETPERAHITGFQGVNLGAAELGNPMQELPSFHNWIYFPSWLH